MIASEETGLHDARSGAASGGGSDAAPAELPQPLQQLAAEQIRLAYDDRVVVDGMDLAVPAGQVTAIVGANGCGKSTVLRGLSRLMRPDAGRIVLDGTDISTLPTKAVARRVGLLPQAPIVPDGITVAELVARGRHPHQGMFRQWRAEDDRVVAECLQLTETVELASRPVEELSGGQRQRVWIAMVLAQRTGLLLLDEPTSFLDIAHQVEVLDLIRDLREERGTTVVMVLHDLTMAARYADHLIAMREGEIVAQGRPQDVVTAENVRRVFGIPSRVVWDEISGDVSVIPVGRHRSLRQRTADVLAHDQPTDGIPDQQDEQPVDRSQEIS